MSELKATTVYDAYWKANSTGEGTGILVYLKSEADRYIGELKEQIEAANTQIENFINNASRIMLMQDKVNDNKCDELRHQKYKRCLAVARRCHNESLWWYSKGYGFEKYDKFWEKWEKRWLELANKYKYKEAK